jgi:hypothetical protein
MFVNTTFEYHQSQTAWCIASSDLLTLKCFWAWYHQNFSASVLLFFWCFHRPMFWFCFDHLLMSCQTMFWCCMLNPLRQSFWALNYAYSLYISWKGNCIGLEYHIILSKIHIIVIIKTKIIDQNKSCSNNLPLFDDDKNIYKWYEFAIRKNRRQKTNYTAIA